MQRYPVRASHRARLTPARLEEVCRECFGSASNDGTAVTASFGALRQLKTTVEGKELGVEVTMDPKVDPSVAAETVRRYNRFLEESTGFSAKERAKRMRKSVTSSDAGA